MNRVESNVYYRMLGWLLLVHGLVVLALGVRPYLSTDPTFVPDMMLIVIQAFSFVTGYGFRRVILRRVFNEQVEERDA